MDEHTRHQRGSRRTHVAIAGLATALLVLAAAVTTPTYAQVAGATYTGTTSIGTAMGLEVSPDGQQVTDFWVMAPAGCGSHGGGYKISRGWDYITDHSFSHEEGPPATGMESVNYSGTFSGQGSQGSFSFVSDFDPGCNFEATWTATVDEDAVTPTDYEGTTSNGGDVGLQVSADRATVTHFWVVADLGPGCGLFETHGYGGDPIVGNSFSYGDEGDNFRYSGTFSGQQVSGRVSYDDPFDPPCSFDATWTANELHILTVQLDGTGTGSVESSPAGMYCSESGGCSVQLGGSVTLKAIPGFQSYFKGWSGGGCSGATACTVTMDDDRTVTATFDIWSVKITKHPAKRTTSRTATFKFTSTAPGSLFTCRLDQQPSKRCGSPKTYKKLSIGHHTFQLQATGRAGDEYGPTASFLWTVKR